ncbi:Kunitz/Bovine pancreatic trypsin inhibitor domain protein [Trichostrongylus colubriformis]|uniref:Kunitz/Bovine pancreatic trypsin inhibitor domain protein n=1 Tax=Trichostrongylus colubriformis TaxID=6319 RepID=A0AAN8F8K0_TRICO
MSPQHYAMRQRGMETSSVLNEQMHLIVTAYYTISEQFPATYGTTLAQKDYPITKGTCKLDRSKGVACKKAKPSVRYYFDYSTASCLAFEYLGCEGNLNNYKDSSTCIHDCSLVDQSGCGGMNPPARLSNGEAINCGLPKLIFPPGYTGPTPPPEVGPKLNDDGCPVNHVCLNKGFISLCCNQANEGTS